MIKTMNIKMTINAKIYEMNVDVRKSLMDVLRDQRRIHSHITAVAYPILEQAGKLRKLILDYMLRNVWKCFYK